MANKCNNSPGHLQFYTDHQQQENYGDDRTIDEKQRNEDHREANQCDCGDRPVATVAHVRNDRRGPGDKRFDSRWRRRPRDDTFDSFDRFVAGTGENYLNICGLTIAAFRGVSGLLITPEILDALYMLRIVF